MKSNASFRRPGEAEALAVEEPRVPESQAAAHRPALSRELAATVGNRAFSALVARERSAVLMRQDAGATATQPRRVRTDFGSFEVYPDDAVSVPVAEAGRANVWPIREAAFAALEAFMATIDPGSESAMLSILPAEDAMFAPIVKLDLAWLQTQPVGGELLAAMAATGKQVSMQWFPLENAAVPLGDVQDSFPDADGTPGPGTDVKIKYHPQLLKIHDGTEPWMRRPPAIGLAHELVHAWTMMTGTRARGGEDERERQASGLGEFKDAEVTENRFRAAFGLPPRPRL